MKRKFYGLLQKAYLRHDPARIKTKLGMKLHTLIFHNIEDAFDKWVVEQPYNFEPYEYLI
jgi:hypothetical protein